MIWIEGEVKLMKNFTSEKREGCNMVSSNVALTALIEMVMGTESFEFCRKCGLGHDGDTPCQVEPEEEEVSFKNWLKMFVLIKYAML